MKLESHPILFDNFESHDSNDDEDYYDNSDHAIDEKEEEYEGDGEDNDGNDEPEIIDHFRNSNISFYENYIANCYPIYVPIFHNCPFYTPNIRSNSTDEFYSANEFNEADCDVENEPDFPVHSLDRANRYHQYEDDRHGDVFGNHNSNI